MGLRRKVGRGSGVEVEGVGRKRLREVRRANDPPRKDLTKKEA